MYALSKGNTKEIIAKTRRGISKYDTFGGRKISKNKQDSDHLPVNEICNPAKPFFTSKPRKALIQKDVREISPQHEEMIKYIHESWLGVMQDYENNGKSESSNASQLHSNHKIFYYKSKSASTPEFEPFDLESFWGQRLYQNLTRSV